MKNNKLLLVGILILAANFLQAQNPSKIIESNIEKVTVFVNSAQITRKSSSILNTGKTELVFKGISPLVDKESIQIKTNEKVTVISVVHQIDNLKEQVIRQEVENLSVKRRDLEEKYTFENSMLQIYKQEEITLSKNQEVGGDNTGLKASDLKEVLDFQRSRFTELKLKQIESSKKVLALKTELDKIYAQLREINAREFTNTSEILVTVSTEEPLTSDFILNYIVTQAGWYPSYDLRVESISKPIQLNYKANVHQSSGEDWNNIKLTLATGNPRKTGIKPELNLWELDYGNNNRNNNLGYLQNERINDGFSNQVSGVVVDSQGEPLPGVTVLIQGTGIGTATDADGRYSIDVNSSNDVLVFSGIGLRTQEINVSNQSTLNINLEEDARELQDVVVTGLESNGKGDVEKSRYKDIGKKEKSKIIIPVTENQNQLNITFDIDVPYTVPNDGKTYTVEIKEEELEAVYQYYAIPKLDENAFLTARIADWETYNLLSGEVNLFFEGTYLGKSKLDVLNVTDTLEISLGRDESVVITREKLKEYSKNQLIGSSKTDSRAWQISVRNKKRESINLIIEDQYPVSVLEEIEVKLLESPEAIVDKATGKLTWKFNLNPAESKILGFKYSVKYPKGRVVILE